MPVVHTRNLGKQNSTHPRASRNSQGSRASRSSAGSHANGYHGAEINVTVLNQDGEVFTPEAVEHTLLALQNFTINQSDKDAESRAARKIQTVFRRKKYPHQLFREHLSERLVFEDQLLRDAGRLLNQILVFLLLIFALRLSSSESYKRSILTNLDSAYGFGDLSEMNTRHQFVEEVLPALSEASSAFFLLGTNYFQDSEEIGSHELLKDMTTLSAAVVGAPMQLKVQAFSFTCWIRLNPNFVDGYLIRKRPTSSGSGSDLSCWGWWIHNSLGHQFRYGAHDYFEASLESSAKEKHHVLGYSGAEKLAPDQYHFLVATVDHNSVKFYQNINLVGEANFSIPITDCNNNAEGLLLGSWGMEIGAVRYYPEVLSTFTISELYNSGDTLSDISTGSKPKRIESSEVELLERKLVNSLDVIESKIERRQTDNVATHILKTVSDSPTTSPRSPACPTGANHASLNATTDPVTGWDYFQLMTGPCQLTETVDGVDDHRYIDQLPSFQGTGTTFTFWYRHVPCSAASCGVYLWTAVKPDNSMCWSLWLEDQALWFDNAQATPPEQYPHHFVAEKFMLNGGESWRFISVTMDQLSDEFKVYYDGELAWKGAFGSAISQADCAIKTLTIGRSAPGWTNGLPVEIYDLRQYVHPAGQVVPAAQVKALSVQQLTGFDQSLRCLSISDNRMADNDWNDAFGNGCDWYFANKDTHPNICSFAGAKANCPIACGSRQECLNGRESPKVYYSWDRIRKISARGSNGTLCLGDSFSKAEVVEQCKAWVAAGGDSITSSSAGYPAVKAWLESMNTVGGFGRQGRRLDYRFCNEIETSIDEYCSFNMTAVEAFTSDLHESNGDFTIAFWVRPSELNSRHTSGRFFPHVQFMASLWPPQHNLAFALWGNPNGESRHLSSCADGTRNFFENVEMKAASDEDWTFLAVSRRNSTFGSTGQGQWTQATNSLRNAEGSDLPQCLYNSSAFFNYLEVNYPMLMSPIMMIPEALPFAEVQRLYLSNSEAVKFRTGPLTPYQERVFSSTIPIDKEDYGPTSTLLAPPLVFQTRTKPSTSCKIEYSTKFIELHHTRVLESRCGGQFACEEDVMKRPEIVMSCPGERLTAADEGFFGLESLELDGTTGFAEFLQSISDNPFLFRDGEVVSTSDFIDSNTDSVSVLFVFFTPETGITSVLQVKGSFGAKFVGEIKVDLQHFQVVEGSDLRLYLFVQSLVIINITIMLGDILYHFVVLYRGYRDEAHVPTSMEVVKQLTDLVTIILIIYFIIERVIQMTNSASSTEEILSGLLSVPWDVNELTLADKKKTFFEKTKELLILMGKEARLSNLCNVILIVNLLRLIQLTGLHPRLAMLTGSIGKALDDVWHAVLLTMLIILCFAGLGTWRFGSYREDFGTLSDSLTRLFEMLFGEFPDDWNENEEILIYTVLYMIIVFLLIQNFLLAIIVEAYMHVRRQTEEIETEQEFFLDIVDSFHARVKRVIYRWPNPNDLAHKLDQMNYKISIDYRVLYRTSLFPNYWSVGTFMNHYAPYPFTTPPEIERALKMDDCMRTADLVEEKVATLLGKEANTVKAHTRRANKELMRVRSMALHKGNGNSAPVNSNGSALVADIADEIMSSRTNSTRQHKHPFEHLTLQLPEPQSRLKEAPRKLSSVQPESDQELAELPRSQSEESGSKGQNSEAGECPRTRSSPNPKTSSPEERVRPSVDHDIYEPASPSTPQPLDPSPSYPQTLESSSTNRNLPSHPFSPPNPQTLTPSDPQTLSCPAPQILSSSVPQPNTPTLQSP